MSHMNRQIRMLKPSVEVQNKIIHARQAIAEQRSRAVKCPYCHRNTIIVFDNTRGHVQAKCKACGQETVFDTVNMRKCLPWS